MIEHITQLDDPRLHDYIRLTDVALRKHLESRRGLYIAESEKVIRRALDAGHTPRSLLVTESWLDSFADVIDEHPTLPVMVVEEELLSVTTGYHVHRGALASMHRPPQQSVTKILAKARTVVVLDGLSDHTNVGAIFRSVVALGADAVLLSPESADPFYRRAVRVSMGAVLQLPWAKLPRWQEAGPLLRDAGFHIASLALDEHAVELGAFVTQQHERIALIFGAEGPGVSRQALAASHQTVTIPMDHGVDSLNVATAAAITLWALREHRRPNT